MSDWSTYSLPVVCVKAIVGSLTPLPFVFEADSSNMLDLNESNMLEFLKKYKNIGTISHAVWVGYSSLPLEFFLANFY